MKAVTFASLMQGHDSMLLDGHWNGAMTIQIANGVHAYAFEYTLPAAP